MGTSCLARSLLVVAALGPSIALAIDSGSKGTPAGVVVEEVGKGSAAEKAEIKPGDVLLSWERAANPPSNPVPNRGDLRSPFDVSQIEFEQAPRGYLRLLVSRQGRSFWKPIGPGRWQLSCRPQMSAATLQKYLRAIGQHLTRPNVKAVEVLKQVALGSASQSGHNTTAWLFFKIARMCSAAGDPQGAQRSFDDAIREASQTKDAVLLSLLWNSKARALYASDELVQASDAFGQALSTSAGAASSSLITAMVLSNLGLVTYDRGDLEMARTLLERSVAMHEALAPMSLPLATSLNNLGLVLTDLADLDAAVAVYKRCVAIMEKINPYSGDHAIFMSNLGRVERRRGELVAAQDSQKTALAMLEKLSPNTPDAIQEKKSDVARTLNHLGNIARDRGDLAAAELFYKRSLAIREEISPDSLDTSDNFQNLGNVAQDRGELALAENLQRKALAIRERLAPGSLMVAASLGNLGSVAAQGGDLKNAESYLIASFEIQQKVSPDSLDAASGLAFLARLNERQGKASAAREAQLKSLSIRQRLAPDSLDVAESHFDLGKISEDEGDVANALSSHRQALVIRSRLAPGSLVEAASLYHLGLIRRREGDLVHAADHLRRAIEALEKQKGRLGGTQQDQSRFAAEYADYYRDYIEVLLELRREKDALQILETSKAQVLLSMLAERDLVFASDIPAELERERKLTDAEYDRTQSQVGGLNPQKDAQKIDELLGRLRELRAKQEEFAEKIRKASPRLASLQYPLPLDLTHAQKVLDPGTVLLAYSVGKEKSFLFVVQPAGAKGSGLSVFTLPVGEKALRESVEALRNLINWKTPPGQGPPPELLVRSRFLYDALIKPAEKSVEKSDRILILPDGPLHTLPFDALVRDVRAGKPQYLVEWKPVHTAVSATVYAELKKERRATPSSSPIVVAAFGDPKYPRLPSKKAAAKRSEDEKMEETIPEEEEVSDPQVRSVVRGGYRLDPLPATRQEVESIVNLYAPKAAKYLGEDATEERAKSIGKDTPYIHFACHGILNERFPLDSALALTIPEKPQEGQDNGLLQAWEIFEKVRIDADLVTLSACETGLGKEMGGEGLVGLTRAFQYAGARSILASLWKVEDESTGELMKRFYGYLKSGKTKDEALRSAQIDLIHSPNLAQPSHWAAFQLIGDWK